MAEKKAAEPKAAEPKAAKKDAKGGETPQSTTGAPPSKPVGPSSPA